MGRNSHCCIWYYGIIGIDIVGIIVALKEIQLYICHI